VDQTKLRPGHPISALPLSRVVPPYYDQRLQSLRGLAALSVIIGHGLIVLPPTLFAWAISGIFEQDAAVVFFYVLSGFVLSQSLRRDSRFFPFLLRRLARLLPVLWASLAAAIVVSIVVAGPPIEGASDWYNVYRSVDTSLHAIVMNATALSWRINSVMWSVQIELFVIPLLPLAVLGTRRVTPSQALIILGGMCVLAVLLLDHIEARPIAYLYCFYIGLLLPKAASARLLQPFFRPAPVLVSLAVTYVFSEVHLYPPCKHIVDALVSAQLILYVIQSPAAVRFLHHPSLVLLGDVSYSLYAFGQVTLTLVAYAMFSVLPPGSWGDHPAVFVVGLIGLTIALAFPIAVASFRWIELPGMALAKSLLNRDAARSLDQGQKALPTSQG